jgi:hypothetical protein
LCISNTIGFWKCHKDHDKIVKEVMQQFEEKVKTRVKKKIIKQVTMVESRVEGLISSGVDALTNGDFELKTIQSGTFKKLAWGEGQDSTTATKKLEFMEKRKTKRKSSKGPGAKA